MIRKVYVDFIRSKLSGRDLGWLLSRGWQFAMIHLSHAVHRPLCGPVLGTLVTNYTCNYHCVMCDLKKRDSELRERGLGEFDTAAMKRVLHSFARLGVSGVGFTGGEPLLRKDIFELLAYTKHLGMITHLNTNGSLLDDGNIANMIRAGVDSLNLSLDGARASTHDSLRGVRGAFDRTVDAVGRIRKMRAATGAALRIKTVAVLQEGNIDEVPDMVRLAGDLGVDCIEFIPRQRFRIDEQPPEADPRFLEKVDRVADYLLGIEQGSVRIENSPTHLKLFRRSFSNTDSPLRCYAGYNSLAVDCYGEVYPCVPWYNWRRPVGNVQDRDLEAFWYSAEYRKVRRETGRCRACYLNCQAELNILFNGMRAQLLRKDR